MILTGAGLAPVQGTNQPSYLAINGLMGRLRLQLRLLSTLRRSHPGNCSTNAPTDWNHILIRGMLALEHHPNSVAEVVDLNM